MLVVPDTNIFVSSILTLKGNPGKILKAWKAGKILIATSKPILKEIERVLSYKHIKAKHKWSPEKIKKYVKKLSSIVILTPGITKLDLVKNDPQDNKFFECAEESEASYIISGDRHILDIANYKGIKTVTPNDFVALLKK